jgi:predicted small lipoprotein YifL
MSRRNVFSVLLPLAMLVAAVLACGPAGPEPTATRAARPTTQPQASATAPQPTKAPTKAPTKSPTKAAAATKEPRATATEAQQAPFTLSADPYVHSSGGFSIRLPEGWNVDPRDHSIFVTSPDNVASIEVNFDNLGQPFDADTLSTYINAVEANWFGTFPDYSANEPETQSDGSTGVLKTLTQDGVAQTVFSYYWQKDNIVYEQDFWVQTDSYDAYVDSLVEVANSMTTDPAAVSESDPYALIYTFTGPNKLFEISVPYGWTYKTSTDTNSTVDTFTAPDGASYVENITYDDGTSVSKSDSGRFALALLKEYYEVNDIKVTADETQPDGSERLDWKSASGGFEGMSFFETRGTTFLLLTWIVNSDSYDLYLPVWTAVVNSYTTPES